MQKMRSGVVVAKGQVVCDDVDFVEPGPGEVVVKSSMASICGSDLHLIHQPMPGQQFPAAPGFPGHEGIGVVDHSDHDSLAVGDRVLTVPNAFAGTCFSELQTLPPRYCIKLPDTELSDAEMLMAQQLGVVIYAARSRRLDLAGATVAVIDLGSAGAFFAWWCKQMGAATVIGSDLSPARRRVAEQLGADITVDGSDRNNLFAAVQDHTGGQGAPFVVEAVGSNEALHQTTALAAIDGDVLMFGIPEHGDCPFEASHFFMKRLHMWGAVGAQEEPGLVSFQTAINHIVRGDIDMSPLVSHRIPIDNIDHAFDLAHERTDNAIKVSISF